jgi:hypothetical protein
MILTSRKRESPGVGSLQNTKPSGPKRNTHRHTIIKSLNTQNKEGILKAVKERRQITYKGKSIRMTADFSIQTLNARRSWKDIIQDLKESNCQPRLLCPPKLSFLIEG